MSPSGLQTLGLVWRLLDSAQRRRVLVLQLLSVLTALSSVSGMAAIVPFFAVLADPNLIASHTALRGLYQHLHFTGSGSFVTALGGAFVVLILLANALNLFGMLAINRFALQTSDAFFVRLFEQYLRRDFGFHLRNSSAQLASTLLLESGRVSIGILRQGLILVANLVTIVFFILSLLILKPLAALGAMLALGTIYVAVYAITRGLLIRNGRSLSRYQVRRTQVVNESLGAIRELIILDVRDIFVQRFADYCRTFSRIELTTLAISTGPRNVLECAIAFCLVGVALYLRGTDAGVGPWLGQLSFIALAAYRLMPALQQTFSAVVSVRANHVALESLAAELERGPDEEPRVRLESPATWPNRPVGEIRVREVSFRYATDRPPAVSNLSLCIPGGSAVGFVGANGSGKTTLVDLLAGLLSPTSGHVEVDGVTIDHTSRTAWQSSIAYVPQNVFLLDATVAENIALGIPRERMDRERLELAVELSRLTDCVASLPNGYAEVLGDRGCRLSGGQRQRLGIARALYREASVLILDEATSALDNTAEEEIVGMLHALQPSRTLLLIAHRFSALRHCEIIHEFRGGEIVRSGSYADLQAALLA
jgi:ABC-type multidrug transport system fused ATPase/permease subunit